jgi:hypothetical protein
VDARAELRGLRTVAASTFIHDPEMLQGEGKICA